MRVISPLVNRNKKAHLTNFGLQKENSWLNRITLGNKKFKKDKIVA